MEDVLQKMIDDPINHPLHYALGRVEVLEFIEDKDLDHHRACAVKYIARAGRKSEDLIQDLKKAIFYIRRKIELLEADMQGRNPIRPNDMVNKND